MPKAILKIKRDSQGLFGEKVSLEVDGVNIALNLTRLTLVKDWQANPIIWHAQLEYLLIDGIETEVNIDPENLTLAVREKTSLRELKKFRLIPEEKQGD